jgi:probable non-F420 flavinoid oxidoreductase
MIGYHSSHEQYAPSELLKFVALAEKSGFQLINSSDHFHPWSERQGHSGFSFSWLGAAMQSTSLPFSVVCAPGQRYHPAIVAQAIATLSEMFPNRFSIYLGSGEALNEKITGTNWPNKSKRNERLLECFNIINMLLHGETVTHSGHVSIQDARLYTLPNVLPSLFGAAVTKDTASWMGEWANGLITIHRPVNELKAIANAFRENGGDGKPMSLKVQVSYSRNYEIAQQGAFDQWRSNVLPNKLLSDLSKVREFDEASENVTMDDVSKLVHISSDPDYFVQLINSFITLGFDNIILHNVNKDQEVFIKDFGQYVLPAFWKKAACSID